MCDGGAERVMSIWMNGFAGEGCDVVLALCTEQVNIGYDIPDKTKVYNIYTSQKTGIISHLKKIGKLRAIIKEERPDLIITALSPWNLWALVASFGIKVKVIHTEHNSFERPESAPMTRSVYFYKYIVNKLFKVVTVLTQADKEFIGKRLNNIRVLPNPLTYQPVATIPQKDKIVLAAGRLDVWHVKGFDNLMKAWNDVYVKHPDWRLHIAGSGSQKSLNYLKSLLSEDAKSSVKFLGFVKEIDSLYRKSSIFVLSSRYDGFGMVLIEAMSQGCACVSTDYNGRQREIISDSRYGITTDYDNSSSIAAGICAMIENPEKRESIQKTSVERSKDFLPEKIMEQWNSIIKEVLR